MNDPSEAGAAGGADGGDRKGGRPEVRRAPRLDPLAVRRQLREEGLRARHSLSQNFLADPDILQAIVDLAAPAAGTRVLEVGPGLGILTGALLEAGAAVTAVEIDRRLAERVRRVQAAAVERAEADPEAAGALTLVAGDILDQQIGTLVRPPYEVVANVPYHITSPILHRFLDAPPRPERLVLMVQREVAERIAAAPGEMSYLSVFVQYHAAVRIALAVPRAAFEPPPDVDSAVVVLEPHVPASGIRHWRDPNVPVVHSAEGLAAPEGGRLSPAEEAEFWRLVQAAFHERRKMIRNVLARQLPLAAGRLDEALEAAGIAGDRRPQTLAVGEWLALREVLAPLPPESRVAAPERPGAPRVKGGAR